MDKADIGLRWVYIDGVRTLHQFQSSPIFRKREDICTQTCARIVILLITHGLEVIEEELAHRFKVSTE